jgi:hypothetical protein
MKLLVRKREGTSRGQTGGAESPVTGSEPAGKGKTQGTKPSRKKTDISIPREKTDIGGELLVEDRMGDYNSHL